MRKRRTYSKVTLCRRVLSSVIAVLFCVTTVIPPSSVFAQSPVSAPINLAGTGSLFTAPIASNLPNIQGIAINPENPLSFDFIFDTNNNDLESALFKSESQKLIKYFLASLTVPDQEFWVNLSPYEETKIIPNGLGQTELGRDMLIQDFLLKRLTSQLLNPDEEPGKSFWEKVYAKVEDKYGHTNMPIKTFNKVWIVPQQATIFEEDYTALLGDQHLKVMLEGDYLALSKNNNVNQDHLTSEDKQMNALSKEIIKEMIIPEIEREINEGAMFANLRQIYNAMILATWYKKYYDSTLLGKVYINQNRTKGIDVENEQVIKDVYSQYVAMFENGAFNFIKEEYDPSRQELVAKQYVSGGLDGINEWDEFAKTVDPLSPGTEAVPDKTYASVSALLVENGTSDVNAAVNAAVSSNGNNGRSTSRMAALLRRSLRGTYQPRNESYLQRLERLAEPIERMTGNKYTLNVVEPGSYQNSISPSVAYTYTGKRKVYIKQRFMDRVTDDELLAVIGHEIAHNEHRDDMMGQYMAEHVQVAGPDSRAARAFNLYENHREIEADKTSFRYMDELGVDRMAMVTALEKAVAMMEGKNEYVPEATEVQIRLEVLRDRILNQDDLTDYYMVSDTASAVSAIGFRSGMTSEDMADYPKRAQDLLTVYELITENIEKLAELEDQEGLSVLDAVDKLFSEKVEELDSLPISISQKKLFSIAFDMAYLEYIKANFVDSEDAIFKDGRDQLYYRDKFKSLLQNLRDFLWQQLEEENQFGPDRQSRRQSYKVGRSDILYRPDRIKELLEMDFPYEFFAKFIDKLPRLIPIIRQKPMVEKKVLPPRMEKAKRVSERTNKDKDRKKKRWLISPFIIPLIQILWPTSTEPGTIRTPKSVSSKDDYGSAFRENNRTLPTNKGPQRAPGLFDNSDAAQLRLVEFLQIEGVLTADAWNSMIGLAPKTHKLNGKPRNVTAEDVKDYQRWFYGIDPRNQSSLGRWEQVGMEAAVVAFQNYVQLERDADAGFLTWDKLFESVEFVFSDPVFVLNREHMLREEAWDKLRNQTSIVMEINGQLIALSRASPNLDFDAYINDAKKRFEGLKSLTGKPLSEEENIAIALAIKAFELDKGIDESLRSAKPEFSSKTRTAAERSLRELVLFGPKVTPESELGKRLKTEKINDIKTDLQELFSINDIQGTIYNSKGEIIDLAAAQQLMKDGAPAYTDGLDTVVDDEAMLGGIDFNPELLDLQIKRDGNGLPLPAFDQPVETMNIEGFYPIIINTTPISVPFQISANKQ